jgi:hypothetical protein
MHPEDAFAPLHGRPAQKRGQSQACFFSDHGLVPTDCGM